MLLKILIESRYCIIEAAGWLVWYKLYGDKIAYKKIQLSYPARKEYVREIFYSFIAAIIFAIVPMAVLLTPVRHYTLFYTNIHQYGMLYFWLIFPVTIIIHDAYFYWIHRLLHRPLLFRRLHFLHHKSCNPTPWSTFSFHPLESFMQAGIMVLIVMIIPVTKWHLLFENVVMLGFSVCGHGGWEIYPKGFLKTWGGKWFNTAVGHNQHHEHVKGNYGLYFLWWDKWMGTLRHDYEEKFEEVASRRGKTEEMIYEGQPELAEKIWV